MSQTIVGFFDDLDQAERARMELMSNGIADSNIQIFSGKSISSSTGNTYNDHDHDHDDQSFMDRIKHFFSHMGDWTDSEDTDYYAEGIRRGGATVSVKAEDMEIDRVSSILTQFGAADINKRAQFYKESGFKNYDMNSAPLSSDQSSEYRNQYSDWEKNRTSDKDEEVFPVIEEKVHVGKRTVENGRVRVYSKMTETPVNEEVRLRDEHVDVERNPVDRKVSSKDMDAFREGEIELRETSEEPVIDKDARVVEEVRVRRRADEHTERINEMARKTDVEVDRSEGLDRKDSLNRDSDLDIDRSMKINRSSDDLQTDRLKSDDRLDR